MLFIVSSYLGRVVASDSKRVYLCSIVGSCLYLIWGSDRNLYGCRCDVATRGKITFICSRAYALFTLHTLLNAIICCSQLNTCGVLGLIRHKCIISHRCSWMVVYVSCCNAQSKSHSDPLDICTLSLFYQLSNYNLFTQHVLSYITKKITPTNLFLLTCSYATSAGPQLTYPSICRIMFCSKVFFPCKANRTSNPSCKAARPLCSPLLSP
jgi:hypothetical protein